MTILNRSFTYGRRIKLNSDDLKLARAGKKTCTIRLGRLSVAADVARLTDGSDELKIKVLRVDNTRTYSELTDEDARMDGLESKAQLGEDLGRYYGEIDPMQPMTVIYFTVFDQ